MGLKQKLKNILRREHSLKTQLDDMDIHIRQWMSLVELKHGLPPIPPKNLQIRVAGAYYSNFFDHGKDMFGDLQEILKSHQLSFLDFNDILDFGCGCGRFLIPMSYLVDPGKLSGTDIDAEAVGWFNNNYSCFKDLSVNGHAPPTKYADEAFDFVFAISIFTHLPEDMQHNWLKELSRIIKPGGYGIFSTHGEYCFTNLSEQERLKLLKTGFHYQEGGATEGLPEFYQTSFHTKEYIKREWADYFDVIEIREQSIGSHHDAVLVRKRLN